MSKRSMLIISGSLLLAALAFVLRDSFGIRDEPLIIATLTAFEGDDITRDFAREPGRWLPASKGARFTLGDGLKTGAKDRANLRLADQSELSVLPNTTLRFLVDADATTGLNVDLERGQAVVHSQRDLSLTTQVGQALLKAGSTIKLDRSPTDLGISVQLGSVRLTEADGDTQWLEDGSSVRFDIGMATLTPSQPPDAGPPDAEIDAEVDAGEAEPTEEELRPPENVQLSTPAGESFVLHVSELPVAVALDYSHKCPGEAELELSGKRQRVRSRGHASVSLNAGTRSYAVHCIGKGGRDRVVARGTMRVVKDPGTRQLPPRPPTSFVDADGLAYTIYYPNQRPDIMLRWPSPPVESSYQLEIDGEVQSVPKPEYLIKSGELDDGIHQLSFRGTTRRSRTTTVEIRFDNNTPTASLSQPDERGFTPGTEVKVEGVALEAWKVSLEGGTITRQSGGRFSGTIAPSTERPDIAVRLSHPRLGVHYYLRRAAASSP
jgi:hypothetical protein